MNVRTHLAPLLALSVFLVACGGDASEGVEAAGSTRPARDGPPQLPRSNHAAVWNAIRALERGDLPEASRSILEIPDEAALERDLLRARLRALEGDAVGAVRAIEAARAEWPDQGHVYGTAAEIHAAAGRLESATDEIRLGLEVAGPTPELTRARGLLSLSRPGGAALGLEHLLAARAADPALPFCNSALAQAHVLLGRKAMAEEQPLEALGHSRAARVALPGDVEALELAAEALEARGDYTGAIAAYDELLFAGVDVSSALGLACQRGSTAALLSDDRPLALERALRARALGLSDRDLGFGATLIEQEASAALDRGVAHYSAGELDEARADFEIALICDPDSLEAHNHLAVVLLRLDDAAGAALHWRRVVAAADRDGLELPEPVHLSLARALRADSRADEARGVLERYLAAHPKGRWAKDTAAALVE